MIYHGIRADEGGRGTFKDLEDEVVAAVRQCEGKKFDVIAVQGVSGMSLGFPLALRLGKDIIVVRKRSDISHSDPETITGVIVRGKRCLFVDDFVSCGNTRRRVREAIEKEGGKLVAEYTAREDAYAKI